MRGLLQPILIVLGVALVAASVASSCRTLTGKPADWQPQPYKCSKCGGMQVIDSDMLGWRCNYCGRWHASGDGLQHVEYDLTR